MRLLGGLIAAVLVVALGTLVVDPFDDDGDDVAVSSPSTTSSSASPTTTQASTSTSQATTSSSRASAAATTTAGEPATTAAPTTSAPTTPTTTLVVPAPQTPEGNDLPRGQGGPTPVTDDLAVTGTGSAVGTALGLLVLVLGAIALEVGRRLLRT
jgi:hypothetical protein